MFSEIKKMLPIACVDVIILYQNKCLLLLRDNEPAKGQYWFPGGRIHKNETIKDAAIRKAKEETGLECSFKKIVSVEETIFRDDNKNIDTHTINICCLLEIRFKSEIIVDKFHRDYKWITKLENNLHPAVLNPLKTLGFNF